MVFRALQLGDLLVAVPALRALRRAAPRAEITLVGLPWAGEFAARFPHLLDSFIPFPGHPALPEREPDLAAWPGFLAQTTARQFGLAVQLHGSGGVTNPIVALFGAQTMAAFVESGAWRPPGRALLYPDFGHESERLLALVTALGTPAQGNELEFPLTSADEQDLAASAPGLPLGPLAVVHAGARDTTRRWPAEAFAAVADVLAARGFHVVLTGSADERQVVAAVRQQMTRTAVDLAGRTSLGALAALLSRAKLLVANDTGVSHLAAAVGTPSVVVFSASDPARWAPLGTQPHAVIDGRAGVAPVEVVTNAALGLATAGLLHA